MDTFGRKSYPRTVHPTFRLLLPLLVAAAALALWVAFVRAAPLRPQAAVFCVKPGGGDGCEDAIQEALDLAQPGDTILVAAGVYNENVMISQTVILQGGWNETFSLRDLDQFTSTIVPADETFSVVSVHGSAGDTGLVAPTVDGFEITGGRADLGSNHGGGLRVINSDAVVINNTIRGNRAFLLGGGIWVQNGAPSLEGNRIEDNLSDGLGQEAFGGGVQLENAQATLTSNLIVGNSASGTPVSYGGGIDISGGSISLNGNEVISNMANPGRGGGLSVRSSIVAALENLFRGNYSSARGGGIFNTGELTVTNSSIVDNASNLGGGIANLGEGILFLHASQIIENVADSWGGGIYSPGSAEIQFSTIKDNSGELGGGIYRGGSEVTGTLQIEDSMLVGNTVAEDGGALYATDFLLLRSQVTSNTAIHDGGCIFALGASGTVTINSSVLSGNSAGQQGGCIYSDSKGAIIAYSTIADNAAALQGGGIYSTAEMTITHSTINSNESAISGGGIYVNFDPLHLENATISGNKALNGGGIANYGEVDLTNVTVVENQAGFGSIDQGVGGGLYNDPGMIATLINTIVAKNEDLTSNVFGPDCYSDLGGINSLGHNLVRIADGCNWPSVPFDLIGDFNTPIEPMLGPLTDNGGDTQTYALLAGSPLIDAGHVLACPATDQRGVSRPADGDGDGQAVCDIGAFEKGLIPLYLPLLIR